MRIALGQLASGADIRANLAAIDRFTAEAARDGAARKPRVISARTMMPSASQDSPSVMALLSSWESR